MGLAFNLKNNFRCKTYWKNKFSGYEQNQWFDDFGISNGNGKQQYETLERTAPDFKALFKDNGDKEKHIILLSALGLLAHKMSSSKDICVLTPVYDHLKKTDAVNSLVPVRMNDFACNFSKLIQDVKYSFLDGLKHVNYPLKDILGYQPEAAHSLSVLLMIFEGLQSDTDKVRADLVFSFHDSTELSLRVKYDADRFSAGYINRLVDLYFDLLNKLLLSREESLERIELVSAPEKHTILHTFNDTTRPFPAHRTIVDLFKEQVQRDPAQRAVQYNDCIISYGELDTRSNQVASYLLKSGVRQAEVVAVMLNRSPELLIVLYGILKAGGVYMPISKEYPNDRIWYSLQNSNCRIVFSDTSDFDRLPDNVTGIDITTLHLDPSDEVNHTSPDGPAYLIYTSGSTGRPKGALIRHRSLVNRLNWMQHAYRIGKDDVILQKTPLVFDVSVWELFWWSIAGASVVLAQPGMEKEPRAVMQLIDDNNITIIHFVPSMLRAFLDQMTTSSSGNEAPLKSLRHLFASGEELSVADAERFLSLCPHVRLHNLYGPTEATVDVSYFEVNKGYLNKRVPIGKPIDNTQLLILNGAMQLQPIGVAGELYIGGENLAVAYINQPELTADRFVSHPWEFHKKLYRTGDLARWMTDGNIEFLGRIDNQVKIRGNRVELDEIEFVMSGFQGVKQSIVIAKESPSGHQLAAFYVAKEEVQLELLQTYLASKLPAYMVPSYFVRVGEIPVTINGKTDRRQLLNILDEQFRESRVAPRSDLERKLCEIWSQVLGHDRIGIRDKFFSIGGDSILAVRALGAISHAHTIELSLQDLYKYETVEALAEFIALQKTTDDDVLLNSVIAQVDTFEKAYLQHKADDGIEAVYPMSDIEKGMCFQGLKDPENMIYYEQNVVPVTYPKFDLEIFKNALALLVTKHPTLRTAFDLDAFAHIIYRNVETPLLYRDLSAYSGEQKREAIEKELAQNRRKLFDVSVAPLWRITVYKLNDGYHQIAVELHHAVMDGWSYASFITELNNTYRDFCEGIVEATLPLQVSYKDVIVKELYQKNNKQNRTFWQNELAGFKKLDLRTGTDKKEYRTIEKDYSLFLLTNLSDIAVKLDTKIKTLFFSAYLYALKMLTYEDDLVVGLVSFNRPSKKDGDKLLGCFLNTVPARIKISPGLSWNEYILFVEKKLTEIAKHDNLSLFEISQTVGTRSYVDNPFFDTIFNFVNFHVFNEINLGAETAPARELHDFGNFLRGDTALDVVMEVSDKKINAKYHYVTSFISDDQIRRFISYYERIIDLMITRSDDKISHLDILDPQERLQLLDTFNNTQFAYPNEETIVTQFERQVLKTPEQVALVFEQVTLTYAELNAKVNSFANVLRKKYHVKPNEFVGLMCERSDAMVVGLLAILKAGGAYVPIDPSYPLKRIGYIVGDSQLRLVVTNAMLAGRVANSEVVLLEDETNYNTGSPDLERVSKPDHLCYMIYTSGSTGNPKGVMISHRNVVNFFLGMDDRVNVNKDDCLLALTSISFDISVLELIWTLCRGVEVVLHPSNFLLNNMDRYVADYEGKLDFSLFFFSSYNSQMKRGKYDLLIDAVKYADHAGFKAVWTPERHFHEFGGLFPNPSVTNSALAMITRQIELRCGSIVSPLHDVIRIAEEWSVVDNLSNGRVGLSFASGWNPNDFALKDDVYNNRHEVMYGQIEMVKRLWQGESITRKNGVGKDTPVKIYPRPVREDLPVWVTAASSEKTFERAGAMGLNLLTHLLGQELDELARKIELYRNARRGHQHQGEGIVTLMLHAYIGSSIEEVEQVAEAPFIEYIKSSVGLTQVLYQEAGIQENAISDEDKERVLKSAFKRYYKTSSLIGTLSTCEQMIRNIKNIGVNEIACLIDFGIAGDKVLEGLKNLKALKISVSNPVKRVHKPVTIMQSTPSFIKLIEDAPASKKFLRSLKKILLGGEAVPLSLVRAMQKNYDVTVLNMYGPTETTVWSCTHKFDAEVSEVSIGRPIRNTRIYILDKHLQPLPIGVSGDLYIGGLGVSNGYWQREALTRTKFISDPFMPGELIYHTGDVAQWLPDGTLKFLGRRDHQIKINGHRIELGEIEHKLMSHQSVKDAIVVQRTNDNNQFLVAYFSAHDDIGANELRAFLSKEIPDYMIPSYFVPMTQLPLTPNGKIDINALPEYEATVTEEYIAPTNDTETKLRDIWAQILKANVEKISVNKSFFELGGHSLNGILLTNAMYKAFDMDFPLQEVFAKPTIAHMAKYIESRQWVQKRGRATAERKKKELIV